MLACISLLTPAFGQSGRTKPYSESSARQEKPKPAVPSGFLQELTAPAAEEEVIRVETELVTVPVRVTDKSGRTVTNIAKEEFKIFENGSEKEIAYFSDVEQPFTVALVLDMSYSSVFKLAEIQEAAKKFVGQLRAGDRVMVISFTEKPMVLCEATSDRKILNIAIEGARIGSGTGLYVTLDMVLNQKLARVPGRKAVVLLSDGVDTTSIFETAATVSKDIAETDALIYPIKYNTYDDVQKSRRTTAPIQYDENDKPYTVDVRAGKGERAEDYEAAKEFLRSAALDTGGRLYNVTSTTNLDQAFANIAAELRKIYSLGYYPSSERPSGTQYNIKVRVYRPDLVIQAKENYSGRQ
jgi:VWFA-related protein